ncbi:unnamed protein product [Rotaria socialis]|uniref:Cilia- and flagella-associated protein 126 n=1 Tax=Rotaria socialis TaxID=392032 RepID=A0A819WK84_9BILA|nr:unnamed protein product [Rotaria socialis]CAF4229100.1 unnamed protein product [Rotaria socialis]CAF4256934.1 unnamed protein product [Rotaria socialis]CAF4487011.1 unnamed protein product [Rotaria socialis]CAF4779271.1 unnamed protein product [Rotaria socialis]
MSRNYSASQYEKSFSPKVLQMYQVPKDPQPGVKTVCTFQHPKATMSLNASSFVANGRGHILPGITKSKRSPFGEFVGTWDLPKKIPGPYHVHPMGRTEKNFNALCSQRDQTIQEMEKARVYAKEESSVHRTSDK